MRSVIARSSHARRAVVGTGAVPRRPKVNSKRQGRQPALGTRLLRSRRFGTTLNPAVNSWGRPAPRPRWWATSSKLPRSYGVSLKSGITYLNAASHSARINARNEVLPVLFSPTSRVSGARRAACFVRKQRKFSAVIWFTTAPRIPFSRDSTAARPAASHRAGASRHCPGDTARRGRSTGAGSPNRVPAPLG